MQSAQQVKNKSLGNFLTYPHTQLTGEKSSLQCTAHWGKELSLVQLTGEAQSLGLGICVYNYKVYNQCTTQGGKEFSLIYNVKVLALGHSIFWAGFTVANENFLKCLYATEERIELFKEEKLVTLKN